MRRQKKEHLKKRLAILFALALLGVLAGLYSGDDVPPEGLGRPLAAVTEVPKTLWNCHLGRTGLGFDRDACIMGLAVPRQEC
jgi:hypothetical protein